ncbi:AAA family ATPase [Streptomyces sp. NPDC004787]|uniref:helix-turn-helix transcriptional regulator n=1 Tax=Streptomyces sp. NPDC004787 TaxID=3154291 RepID=UPI0033A24F1C
MREVTLLERGLELAALDDGVRAAQAGAGALVVVSGPPGLGKTRLLGHLQASGRQQGLRVLTASGSMLEREIPFGLLRQLLDVPLAQATEEDRKKWLSGPAAAAEVALGRKPAASAEPGEFAILYGLFWLVSNLCSARPTALILDDLHWADEPSLRFLAYLLPRLRDLPLMVGAGVRDGAPDTASHLLDVILGHSSCRILPLAPLSAQAVEMCLEEVFNQACDREFAASCYRISGGNPLMLNELARAVDSDGIKPTAANADRILRIGGRAARRRVTQELRRLSSSSVRLAETIAVLGSDATLKNITQLSGLSDLEAAQGIEQLERAHLLSPGTWHTPQEAHRFVHPMVASAVYEEISYASRIDYHAQAAQFLSDAGMPAEQISRHLLRMPSGIEASSLAILRQAAAEALAEGAPEAALAYLRRLLAEPTSADQRLELTIQAGLIAARIDLPAATDLLRQALFLAEDHRTKSQIASLLGTILLFLGRAKEAVSILTATIRQLPVDQDDLRRSLEATLLNIPMVSPGWKQLLQRVETLRALPPSDTMEAKMLDCMIAAYDTYTGNISGLQLARDALAEQHARTAAGQGAFLLELGAWTLIVGDPDEGIAAFDAIMAEAHTSGTLAALFISHLYRSLGWLRRGDLADAESDLREAERLQGMIRWPLAQPVMRGLQAETLLEFGRTADAETVLDDIHIREPLERHGFMYYYLYARAKLLFSQGRHKEALNATLEAGSRFSANGGINPAVIPWRSEAALCLHALHRDQEAREYATTELALSRSWGAPYALGRSLRVNGLVTPGSPGLDLLYESVEVLQTSTARLEHAKSLLALGSALRRRNSRAQARPHLAKALSLARTCQATPVADQVHAELSASGYSVPDALPNALDGLTGSEERIARLAAKGLTNRQIAQQSFITVKTVEGHLSAIYRKLGLSRRSQLAVLLQDEDA